MKASNLNVSLGIVLSVAVVIGYGFLLTQISHLNEIGAVIFFLVSLALLPIFIIGLSVALSNSKFQKFSSGGFKVGAFLLITLLMYVIWEGPSYWPFTLAFGAITGGLLFALIKLKESLSKLIFTLFGLAFAALMVTVALISVN